MSQCRTHRLADGQLLPWLQTLLCTPPSLCLQKVCALLLMAQQLRALTALLEDLSSVLQNPHWAAHYHLYLQPQGTSPCSGPHIHVAYRNTVDGKPRYFFKRVCSALESSSSDSTLLVKERLTNSAKDNGGCLGTCGQRQATQGNDENWVAQLSKPRDTSALCPSFEQNNHLAVLRAARSLSQSASHQNTTIIK